MSDRPTKLEETFNLPAGSTPSIFDDLDSPIQERAIAPAVAMQDILDAPEAPLEDQDDAAEDQKISTDIEEVRKLALRTFRQQVDQIQDVDPRYAARTAEVAAQYLKIALDATKERVEAKYKKGKMKLATQAMQGAAQAQANIINGTTVVANRNDVLRQLFRPDHEKGVAEQMAQEMSIKGDR